MLRMSLTSDVSRHMRAAASASLLLLVLASLVHGAGAMPPEGKNCSLALPPAGAGEEMNHGQVLRVFPRAKDIGVNYSGCQVLFAPAAGEWQVVSLTEVVNGEPVRVWSDHEKDEAVLACRYASGKVIAGDPDNCPMPELLLVKSMAPGCVKAMQEAVAKQGLGARRPRYCEHQ